MSRPTEPDDGNYDEVHVPPADRAADVSTATAGALARLPDLWLDSDVRLADGDQWPGVLSYMQRKIWKTETKSLLIQHCEHDRSQN